MNTYKKITKAELINMFELEKAMHESTKVSLEKVSKILQEKRIEVISLNSSVDLANKTIARLTNEETVRQDMEPFWMPSVKHDGE